jgi:hypothetical protein
MKKNPILISFLQALGLSSYISLVAVIFWKGNEWFGTMHRYLGPLLVLTLLVASALICGAIALGYPLQLALEKKRVNEAIKIVVYTILWILAFFSSIILIISAA